MDENHWFQIGFLFCAGFGAGWVFRSKRPVGNKVGSALVFVALAVMQVPHLVVVEPPQGRIIVRTAYGVMLLALVLMSVMGRRHRTTAV